MTKREHIERRERRKAIVQAARMFERCRKAYRVLAEKRLAAIKAKGDTESMRAQLEDSKRRMWAAWKTLVPLLVMPYEVVRVDGVIYYRSSDGKSARFDLSGLPDFGAKSQNGGMCETGGAHHRVDEDTGQPYWELWGADWKDSVKEEPGKALEMIPGAFPPGTEILVLEPDVEDAAAQAFYDAMAAREEYYPRPVDEALDDESSE